MLRTKLVPESMLCFSLCVKILLVVSLTFTSSLHSFPNPSSWAMTSLVAAIVAYDW